MKIIRRHFQVPDMVEERFYVRDATLIINDGLIQNNSSNSGGAIYNTSFGTTIINGGVIKGNTAVGDSPSGSAIFHSCKNNRRGYIANRR